MNTTTRRTMVAAGAAAVLLLGAAGAAAAAGGPNNGGGQDWSGGGGPVAAAQTGSDDAAGDPVGPGPMGGRGGGWMDGRGAGGRGPGDCLAGAPVAELTEAQRDTLLHMREEEQLAHDLYVALAEQWDSGTFSRIAASESRHMAAVQRLLDRYGLTARAPADGEKFADDALQQLWDDLLAKGMSSQDAAMEVGQAVERADIADLEQALQDGQPTDITRVYQKLLTASERHLAAFGG